MTRVKGLIPLEEQASKLSLNFMNRGYSVGWLNMSMPPYSTRSYALAPFEPVAEQGFLGHNHYWSGYTVLYQADLNCHSARSAMFNPDSRKISFDDGEGCFARDLVDQTTVPYVADYITYWGNQMDPKPDPSYSLNNSCGEKALHESLAYLKCSNQSVAIFCWSEYYEQDVEATITLSNKSVRSIRPINGRRKLPGNVFNSSRFEQIISTQNMPDEDVGTPPQTPLARQFDKSGLTTVDARSRLGELAVSASGTSLVPFMFGLTNYTLDELCSPDSLAVAYQDTYRTLFALAIQSLFSETATNDSTSKGILQISVGAVVMIEAFTYMVIVFLAIITLLLIYVLCAYNRRVLNLPYSPNSIGSILAVARHQMSTSSLFQHLSFVDNAEFARKLKDVWFHLEHDNQGPRLISTAA